MPTTLDDLLAFADSWKDRFLPIRRVGAGVSFWRIMETRHTDFLGSGLGDSRFSDPRRAAVPDSELYTVVYGAQSLETAFEEVIVRDRTDGRVAPHYLTRRFLEGFHAGTIQVTVPLRLVDLTDFRHLRLAGIPTDVTSASAHEIGRKHALAFHRHLDAPDGILYRSRFTHAFNVAIFSRAVRSHLVPGPSKLLMDYDLTACCIQSAIRIVTPADGITDVLA